jgi:thioredoxin-like negative regulator of GroEL
MRDRKFEEDGGRLRVLDGLELLGDGNVLTDEIRSRLSNLLF